MVIVMDMDTGKFDKLDCAEAAKAEFGEFVDEVMNAGWLPQPALRLETHDHAAESPVAGEDAEAFLSALYRNQE